MATELSFGWGKGISLPSLSGEWLESESGGVDKCDLCHFHLKGNCQRGSRCTYAHSWAERIEWTCPICTVDGKLDCDQKWQHILKYRRVGVYTVLDGRTVGEFLKSHVT